MKTLVGAAATTLLLATAAVATPAQAALPVTMEGTACTVTPLVSLCGDGTFVFNRRGRGTIDVSVLGLPYTDTFLWRYVRARNVVEMQFSDGSVGEFTPFRGCASGTFPAGGFNWDFDICIVP